MSRCSPEEKITILSLPNECQTNILSFLRAFELTAVQQTCRYYNDSQRIHTVVSYFVDHVYGHDLAKGSTILQSKMARLAAAETGSGSVPSSTGPSSSSSSLPPCKSPPFKNQNKKGGRRKQNHHNRKTTSTTSGGGGLKSPPSVTSSTNGEDSVTPVGDDCGATASPAVSTTVAAVPLYTIEDLRTIELNVCARVLSLPEPKTGFYVSKAWIKKTLLWLEKVNEPMPSSSPSPPNKLKGRGGTSTSGGSGSSKKLSKKQERQRNRRLSDVSPPWPNVNSDILCEHQNLQHCGAKAGRSRRKLMDKHAWKVRTDLIPKIDQ